MLGASMTSNAQATRTWVSGVGDDANPCSRTAPCKTFAGAISKTATNGEINCLDPGGFGAVTITKSITIDCEDTQGSILAAGTNGVIVNITAAADTKKSVMLRGISINGAATGINGVRVLAANQVTLDEVIIFGFTTHGVSLENTTGATKVNLLKTVIRNNVGNGVNSFIIGGNVSLAIDNCNIHSNATGVNLSNGTNATVADSSVSNNTTGVLAFNATLGVMRSNISHNTTGVNSSTGGTIRLTGNMITNNGTGLTATGNITSFSNNMFQGNTSNGTPTTTTTLQ